MASLTQLPLPTPNSEEEEEKASRRCNVDAQKQEPSPKSRRKVFDWISDPRNLTPFQDSIVNGVDWNKSPLGPMRDWPVQLKQMVLMIVADPSPAVVYWGDDATIVYNEAYTSLIQQRHPALQGQDPSIVFPELWDYFARLLANQRENCETVVEEEAMVLIQRKGYLEEAYFSWRFIPIVGNDGYVVGSYATVVEVRIFRKKHPSLVLVCEALGLFTNFWDASN